MRILFFARKKRCTPVPDNIAKGLEKLGQEVKLIRYPKWTRLLGRKLSDTFLRRVARSFRPDLVLVWKSCISVSLLAELAGSCKTTLFCHDALTPPPEELYKRARLTDIFLLTNSGQLEMYAKAGVKRPVFWPDACDVEVYHPVESPPDYLRSDVAFIGAPRTTWRQQVLSAVDREFELEIWGSRWEKLASRYRGVQGREVLPDQYAAICAGAKVMLGCDGTTGLAHYFSNRTWFTLGCRGFLLTNYSPGLETFFENHRHLVWYHSPDECVDLLRHYLPRDDDRLRIAHAGCELVRTKHTYVHRAQELIKLIDDLPATSKG